MSLLDLLEKSVKPILTRYYVLRSHYVGVKLHHIKQSDPEFHTHPWWGVSFHLKPYTEERITREEYDQHGLIKFQRIESRCRWFINIVSPWTPHRVITNKPMWTLFIHGPRVNENWQYGGDVAPWRGPDKQKESNAVSN